MVTEGLCLMTNSILMTIIFMISIVITGCTSQPPPLMTPEPIPEPPPTMVMVNDKVMVMESLTEFNNLSNSTILFLKTTQDINKLESDLYHRTYIASRVIIKGLDIYKEGINNWNPPINKYQDELIEIKKAEIYRIDHFTELTHILMAGLISGEEDLIKKANNNFIEWRSHPDNRKPADLQNDILIALEIDADSVNFKYIMPKEEPKLPPQFRENEGRS